MIDREPRRYEIDLAIFETKRKEDMNMTDITDADLDQATKFRKQYAGQIKKVSLVKVAIALQDLVSKLARENEPKKPAPLHAQVAAVQAGNVKPGI